MDRPPVSIRYFERILDRYDWPAYDARTGELIDYIYQHPSEFFGDGRFIHPVVVQEFAPCSRRIIADFLFVGPKENAVVSLQAGTPDRARIHRKRVKLRAAKARLENMFDGEFNAYVLGRNENGPWRYRLRPVAEVKEGEPCEPYLSEQPFVKIGE